MWSDGHQMIDSVTPMSNLKIGVSGQVTAGMIVAKQDCRQIAGKGSEERGALSLTVRDASAMVNVTCWGTFPFIQQLAQRFFINDVVKLVNCNVQDKPEQDKLYSPATNVPFKISLDQKSSKVESLTYGSEQYECLQHKPACRESDVVTLDLITKTQYSYVGRFVNCLVLVKTAPNKRTFATKTGRQATCCEFEVMDGSKEVLKLIMWLESLADLTYSLVPKQTILFLTDVKVKMDTFAEAITLEATSKTVVTVNPDIKSAHLLYAFAQKLPDDILQPSILRITKSTKSQAPLSSREVTVEEVVVEEPESGVLNAVLTKFDCTDVRRCVSKRCGGCQKKVPGLCAKPECFGKDVLPFYDFTVSLTDHTGTIDNVKLTGESAEKLIGVPVSIFEDWDADMMAGCMDRVQLERYKVIFTTFVMPSGIWLQIKQVDSWVSNIQTGS